MTLTEARAWTTTHGCAERCAAMAAEAPPFTEEQRQLLAALKAAAQARLDAEHAA